MNKQRASIAGVGIIFFTAIIMLSLVSPSQGYLTISLANIIWKAFGWTGVLTPLLTGYVGYSFLMLGMGHPTFPERRYVISSLLLFVGMSSLLTIFSLIRANAESDYIWTIAKSGGGGGYVGSALVWTTSYVIGLVGTTFVFIAVSVVGATVMAGFSREKVSEWAKKKRSPAPITTVQKVVVTEQSPVVAPPPPTTNEEPTINEEIPSMSLVLRAGKPLKSNEKLIDRQQYIIEQTLEGFGAPCKVVEILRGPTVTMFGIEPQYLEARSGRRTKVKVSKVTGLSDDLSLALAKKVRIQAPVPGKGYIGVEVPTESQAVVSLRDIMESASFQQVSRKSPLAIGLGQDVSGNPISADLAKMPHLLIAGATGSGKSVCVNTIIACLLLKNTADDLRFLMIDPKRVELTGYNGIPHLYSSVVVDMDKVVGTLQWALREMDQRYQAFATIGARNISSYNSKRTQSGGEKLPYIVIVIDELADLMMTAAEETEQSLARLAQMARATGIHMIIATQRPSVNVVTGLIKANFPARIAFAVSSSVDSRVILDQTGAEQLMGMGDMLFQQGNSPAPVRMQGCYVSDEELSTLIDSWKMRARPKKVEKVIEPAFLREAGSEPRLSLEEHLAKEPSKPPVDDLWNEAVVFVRKKGKASTSRLQREFQIGYSRAARIIDAMEEEGIIGPPTGSSKARTVIPEKEE